MTGPSSSYSCLRALYSSAHVVASVIYTDIRRPPILVDALLLLVTALVNNGSAVRYCTSLFVRTTRHQATSNTYQTNKPSHNNKSVFPLRVTDADAAIYPNHIASFSKRAAPLSQMSARTSAAGREASPLPQPNTTSPTNEAQMKQSKKLSMSGKLFRLDSPAKSVKPTTPTSQRINGEGEHNCG